MSLLRVHQLEVHFDGEDGVVCAVDGISFELDRGEVLGVVGESGSGKTVASLSILGLVPSPAGKVVGGEIWFCGADRDEPEDLLQVDAARLREIRGARIAMVFQDPMTSLNPYMTIGRQLCEVLEVHEGLGRASARQRASKMLADVGIAEAARRLDDYPHQLSGGQRQRVMIAMALLCQPDLLIADEPTTALDVTIQAQILSLIEDRKEALGLATLLITHDLGVVARMADRIAVMYAGRIVEEGPTTALFEQPLHPYTRALKASIPRIDDSHERGRLEAIEGMPPAPGERPAGCCFWPRCPLAVEVCRERQPDAFVREIDGGEQRAWCHLASETEAAG